MSQSDTPQFSIVVTCKNRLHHIQQTLPKMLEQTNTEVILVDYGCPQGTAQWARETFADNSQLVVLEVTDDPVFCLTRARNLGATRASGRFLFFADADIILEKDLCAWASANVDETGFYLRAKPEPGVQGHTQTHGSCIVAKDRFDRIGGYDEAFRGWGGEDNELYDRLRLSGLEERTFPTEYLSAILHGDEERHLGPRSGGNINKRAGLFIGGIYRVVKFDLAQLTGRESPLEERMKIMAYIKKAYFNAYEARKTATTLQFSVSCPGDQARHAKFERTLSYRLMI